MGLNDGGLRLPGGSGGVNEGAVLEIIEKQIGSTIASQTDGRLESLLTQGAGIWIPATEGEARPSRDFHYIIIATFTPTHATKYDVVVNPEGA